MRKVIYRNNRNYSLGSNLGSHCHCVSKHASLGSHCHCVSKPMGLFDPNTVRQQSGGVLDQYTPQELDLYLTQNKNFKDYLAVLNSFVSSDTNNISKLERVLKSDPIILQVLKEGLERGNQVEIKKKSIIDRMKQNVATMGVVYVKQQANKYCDKFLNWILGKLGSAGSAFRSFLNMGKSIAETALRMSLCDYGVEQGLEVLGNATFMSEFEDWLGVELITNDEELKTMQYGTVPAEKQKIAQAVSAITAGIRSGSTSGGHNFDQFVDQFAWMRNHPQFAPHSKYISDLVQNQTLHDTLNNKLHNLRNLVKYKAPLNLDQIEGESDGGSQAFSARNVGIGLLILGLGVGTWYAVSSD